MNAQKGKQEPLASVADKGQAVKSLPSCYSQLSWHASLMKYVHVAMS